MRYIVFLITVLWLFGSCARQQQETSKQHKQPNIILIVADDMGWGDLGIFHQNQRRKDGDPSTPWHATPNLDKLAMSGARLPHHYAAAPVCAPSRASLLTGLSQGHARVRDNQFDKALADNHTIARVLSEAGYATAAIGKWGLQGKSWPWKAHPLDRGFDYFLGYMRHLDGHEHYPKEGPYGGSKQVWKNRTIITHKLDKTYTADLWTAATKHWIIEHERKDGNQPFFVYLAYDTPHAVLELPTQPYPEGGGLDGGLQWIGEPGHMINTSSGTIDSWIYPRYAKATYDHDNDPSTPQVHWPKVYQRYATAIRRIDSGVGDIMQLLEDLGIRKNTLIVFTSDNGPSRESYLPDQYQPNEPTFFESYGPFDGIKRDVLEGGIRVPTIASWPGHIPAGSVMKNPSANYDWLATFADVAGVPVPANSDGVTLLPALTGKAPERGVVYVEYYHPGRTPSYEDFAPAHRGRLRNEMQMIRMGNYVGVRYNIQSARDDFAIYNIVKDPGQEHNLAAGPDTSAFIQKLQKKMKARVLQVRMPNPTAPRPYDDALVPPVQNIEVVPGVVWKSFEGEFPWLPKVWSLQPDSIGFALRPNIDVDTKEGGVLFFTGYINIPRDGTYTFSLRTDTGALLRLHKATVIDAGYGYQSGTVASGTIHLQAGLHPFRLYYRHNSSTDPFLKLKWSGPEIPKQPVPADIFFHKNRN